VRRYSQSSQDSGEELERVEIESGFLNGWMRMNELNREYTDDELLIGLIMLQSILQELPEEAGLKFDAFDLWADRENDKHVVTIFRNENKLEPMELLNKQIADCSLSEENQEKIKVLLKKEIDRRLNII
jgi:hypothetical protein